jgi:hypothetical protein
MPEKGSNLRLLFVVKDIFTTSVTISLISRAVKMVIVTGAGVDVEVGVEKEDGV